MDFVLRLTLALSAHSAISNPAFNLALTATPGPETLREGLKNVQRHATGIFTQIAQAGIKLLDTPLPGPHQNIRSLRNHLFHGGSKPIDAESEQIAAALSKGIDQTASKIASLLAGAHAQSKPSMRGPARAELELNGNIYQLSPLLAFSLDSNALLVFSRLTTSALNYTAAKYEPGQHLHLSEDEPLLRRFFRQPPADSFLSNLIQTATDDLEGFREPGSTIPYITDNDGVLLTWKHADGGRTNERSDMLRVGPNNAWQWRDGSTWRSYSEFLCSLANWPLLTQRLSNMLDESVAQAKQGEERLLPLPSGVSSPFISPTLQVGPIGSQAVAHTLIEFSNRLNQDVEANRGTTYLYFVHAEAGAGKTTALMMMAQDRAREEVTKNTSGKPLYLYISARGNVLENLDQAVNATVTETRLLTSRSVQALCKNGLIIPIIDGFDELVGSPTYADALSSLRPWLKALGGRGVLVVSARSSYFLSLYEESIRRETNLDISVNHYIAVLNRWTPEERNDYMRDCGVTLPRLNALPSDEAELLRLPFFARASIAHLRAAPVKDSGGLLAGLIRDYVVREQRKLQIGDRGDLVTAEVLEALFGELAGWMLENNTREVALNELQDIADQSAGRVLPELRHRVVALCGLDAHGAGDRRFKFSHEVFLDFFFGRYVARFAVEGKLADLKRILTRCQLTPSATRVVWSRAPLDKSILETLTNGWDSPLPANVGLLWTRLFATPRSIEHVNIHRVRFAQVDLTDVSIKSLSFHSSDFASVKLPNKKPGALRFTKCNIEELSLSGNCHGVTFENCIIGSVSSDSDGYVDEIEKIVPLLRGHGAEVISAWPEASMVRSNISYMARFFLEKIKARATISIVLGDNHLPENDPRQNWISHNAEAWLAFIHALKEYNLAYEEPLGAGGPYKLRLRLTLPPDIILRHNDREIDDVERFWQGLGSGRFG